MTVVRAQSGWRFYGPKTCSTSLRGTSTERSSTWAALADLEASSPGRGNTPRASSTIRELIRTYAKFGAFLEQCGVHDDIRRIRRRHVEDYLSIRAQQPLALSHYNPAEKRSKRNNAPSVCPRKMR